MSAPRFCITAQNRFFFLVVKIYVLLLISAHERLLCLPLFHLLSEQAVCFLLGVEQQD